MSEIASVVDRARSAFASVSRLEQAVARDPSDIALQLNLSAMVKAASQARRQLMQCSEYQHVELCDYRLLPAATDSFGLAHVSRSLLEFQNLFTQIHDAVRNGAKQRIGSGQEATQESSLELAYTYGGSLGAVLYAQSERDFFEGRLDGSIDSLLEVMSVKRMPEVRQIAERYGKAVVKRMHDWSDANVKGGFATDVRWSRSDGRQLGHVVERDSMANMLNLMAQASDESRQDIVVDGVLVGGDVPSRSFHFVVPEGADYRGSFAQNFPLGGELTLNRRYRAVIQESVIEQYAIEKIIRRYEIKSLDPLDDAVAV